MTDLASRGVEAQAASGEAASVAPPVPTLRPVPTPSTGPTPLAANVLLVGNPTRTLATLASSLKELGVTSRATLSTEDIFGLRANLLPTSARLPRSVCHR